MQTTHSAQGGLSNYSLEPNESTSLPPHLRHQHHYTMIPTPSSLLNITNFSLSTVHSLTYSTPASSYNGVGNGITFSSNEMSEIEKAKRETNVTGGPPSNLTCFNSPYHTSIYQIAIPVMLFFCILSILVNLLIVVSARWCRRPMSPTLYFSISLALADAFASLTLATGLTVNSLLPCIYDIKLDNECFQLTIEVLRLGGILITAKHLLALGINHWIGIVRPLHYAATMTRRTAWFVIIFSWIFPILLLFIYFSCHEEQGFRTEKCKANQFMNKRTFRAIFSSLFFGPLALMSMIYIHIFLIVKNHHQHRLRYQSCQQLKRNIKAVVTTILILGTYILGWIPGILWFIIVCDNCLYQLKDIPQEVAVPIGILNNTLIILKAFVNPIIYAARMSDIQMALRKMQYEFLTRCCGKCGPEQPPSDPLERGFSKIHRSLCETRSLRMSSRGSSSSSRRAGAVNSINATHPHAHPHQPQTHPPTNHLNNNNNGNGNGNNNRVAFEMSEWN